jgi:hypothetical protein
MYLRNKETKPRRRKSDIKNKVKDTDRGVDKSKQILIKKSCH